MNKYTRTGLILALVVSLCPIASSADKQSPLPKELPPYGRLETVRPKPLKEIKLENGLEVWLVPEPGFPKLALAMAIRAGYAADPTGLPSMADLLASVVTQGTRTRSARQIAEEFQGAGGDVESNATAK